MKTQRPTDPLTSQNDHERRLVDLETGVHPTSSIEYWDSVALTKMTDMSAIFAHRSSGLLDWHAHYTKRVGIVFFVGQLTGKLSDIATPTTEHLWTELPDSCTPRREMVFFVPTLNTVNAMCEVRVKTNGEVVILNTFDVDDSAAASAILLDTIQYPTG